MYQMLDTGSEKIVGIKVSGWLTHKEYGEFIPLVEKAIERAGEIRIFFQMEDFRGWAPRAAFDDLRFDFRHNDDVERAVMVGDKVWEKWLTNFSSLFAK